MYIYIYIHTYTYIGYCIHIIEGELHEPRPEELLGALQLAADLYTYVICSSIMLV